jgi:hypothetical protein
MAKIYHRRGRPRNPERAEREQDGEVGDEEGLDFAAFEARG